MVQGRKRRTQRQKGPDTSTWTPQMLEKHLRAKRMQTPVAEMALSVRTINALESRGLILAESLMCQTYESLMDIKNFGDKTLDEVRDALTKLGLQAPLWSKPEAPAARVAKDGIFDLWG